MKTCPGASPTVTSEPVGTATARRWPAGRGLGGRAGLGTRGLGGAVMARPEVTWVGVTRTGRGPADAQPTGAGSAKPGNQRSATLRYGARASS
jgi:hypothetical protein